MNFAVMDFVVRTLKEIGLLGKCIKKHKFAIIVFIISQY